MPQTPTSTPLCTDTPTGSVQDQGPSSPNPQSQVLPTGRKQAAGRRGKGTGSDSGGGSGSRSRSGSGSGNKFASDGASILGAEAGAPDVPPRLSYLKARGAWTRCAIWGQRSGRSALETEGQGGAAFIIFLGGKMGLSVWLTYRLGRGNSSATLRIETLQPFF